jgi:hypothetical protein
MSDDYSLWTIIATNNVITLAMTTAVPLPQSDTTTSTVVVCVRVPSLTVASSSYPAVLALDSVLPAATVIAPVDASIAKSVPVFPAKMKCL